MMTYEDAERILCNQCIHNVHCMIHDEECEPMKRLKQPQWIPCSERLPEEPEDGFKRYIVQRASAAEPRSFELVLRFKVDELNNWARKNKLTIRGMSGEKLIITDQVSGEEYVVEDLGYPF